MLRTAGRLFRVLTAAGVFAAALAGCASPSRTDISAIRSNPTPQEDTLYQNSDDIHNSLTIMADENFRMFTQDLGRAFYWDRPSRLTREPVR